MEKGKAIYIDRDLTEVIDSLRLGRSGIVIIETDEGLQWVVSGRINQYEMIGMLHAVIQTMLNMDTSDD
ncbi:MAG: hypothetical protein JRN02_07230 [Nitrososphaerota archaeon]|nr:hypothetical protein [Nitrososphaerota archaeon]